MCGYLSVTFELDLLTVGKFEQVHTEAYLKSLKSSLDVAMIIEVVYSLLTASDKDEWFLSF